ncbi:hypothetical protein [Bradyrhizobium sp. CCBAU 21365]|nr:hypothetical protein [Bradyrhizobium sp. CCBAU 21365]
MKPEIEELEKVAAAFDFLYQDGVIRPPEEQAKIRSLLTFIEQRISFEI